MKYVIASDIHGSAYYTEKLLSMATSLNADKIILLGDVYNHGPRNRLPDGYDTMKVASLLNGVKDKLLVIKGNCDSVVDTMISEFDFLESGIIVMNGKTIFLTHGHVYNKDNLPKTGFDLLIYGHFHTGFIENVNGRIIANTGSISLPKNNTANSFMVLDESELSLIDIESGNIITKTNI